MKFASITILATVSAWDMQAGSAYNLQELIVAAAAAAAPITTDSTSVNKAMTVPSTMPMHVASTMTGGSPMHVASTMTGGSPMHVASTMTGGSPMHVASTMTGGSMTLSAVDLNMVSGTAAPMHVASTMTGGSPMHVASTMTGGSPMHVASTMTGGSTTLSAADLAKVSGTAVPMMMKTKPVTVQTAAHKALTQSMTMPKISETTAPTLDLSGVIHAVAKASIKAGDKDTQSVPVPKVALPVTKEMMNGEMHHCVVMPAAKAAAPASTVKTVATKVKTLMNLATPATVVAPATKVCSKDLNKVIAHAKAVIHPTKAVAKKTHSGATYLATGAAVAATLFAMA